SDASDESRVDPGTGGPGDDGSNDCSNGSSNSNGFARPNGMFSGAAGEKRRASSCSSGVIETRISYGSMITVSPAFSAYGRPSARRLVDELMQTPFLLRSSM